MHEVVDRVMQGETGYCGGGLSGYSAAIGVDGVPSLCFFGGG